MTGLVTRTRRMSAAGMFAASTLLHVVGLCSVPEAADRVDGAGPEPTSIDFDVDAPDSARELGSAAAVTEAEVLVPPRAPRRAAQREQGVERRATAMRSEAAGSEGLPVARSAAPEAPTRTGSELVASNVDGGPALAPRAPALGLDPRSVAFVSLVDPDLTGAKSGRRDDVATSRGAELSASLETFANDNPRRRRGTPPVLVHNPDGTLGYAGDAIRATILPDGRVRFDDKPLDPSLEWLQPTGAGDRPAGSSGSEPPGLAMTPEDIVLSQQSSVVIKVAGRAWSAERSWFLRETASIRAELADAAHARELARGEHDLRRELDRIWCATRVSAAERRREMFALWDNTSGDEVGARGRRAIEQYMRENLPPGSPLAFPETQLAELNSHRSQREEFDPYGAGRDDGGGEGS